VKQDDDLVKIHQILENEKVVEESEGDEGEDEENKMEIDEYAADKMMSTSPVKKKYKRFLKPTARYQEKDDYSYLVRLLDLAEIEIVKHSLECQKLA
jgi:hypothetical protein